MRWLLPAFPRSTPTMLSKWQSSQFRFQQTPFQTFIFPSTGACANLGLKRTPNLSFSVLTSMSRKAKNVYQVMIMSTCIGITWCRHKKAHSTVGRMKSWWKESEPRPRQSHMNSGSTLNPTVKEKAKALGALLLESLEKQQPLRLHQPLLNQE